MENNVQQVVDLLNDISKVATIVQDNDLADLYIAQGGANLGKEMPEKDFLEAEHKVLKIMDALKDIHREVVQNIENKYISGLEDAVEALNKVNEGKNQYKSDHLTYEETTTTYINNGLAGPVEQTSTETKHFTLSDILNSDKSPIPAAAAKYNEKLKVAKERLKKLEQSDKETYNKIKDLTDRKLVDSFYPTEMGEYKRLKSTWSKDNEQWLGWVENGVKIVGVGLLVVGSIASGGTLAPVAFGTGTALLGGEALYRAGVGETISGDVLSTEQRWWAGAEAVTTLASGGLSTATKVAGTTASESLLAAEKFAHMTANVYDAAQFGHDFMEDPQMALTNLATSQMIGRTIGHLGSKYKAYRASQTGNVDIRSGEATSFKANIKERANTAWTDIKTKAGDVKVQAGESFENFKNRVSNVKNQAISASTEGLSNKVRNFSDAIETGRQNIHNTLDSLGNKNRLSFVTVDDVPVDLPKSKVSTKMDDFANRIQQISVEHKQKIEAFEGRGGGSVDPKVKVDDISDTKIHTPESIISERTKGLDLEPHPTTQKQLSQKRMRELKQKIADRTITREEYEQYDWNKRFSKRRRDGVDLFWLDERKRLMNGEASSRAWTSSQRQDIIDGKKPTYNGKTLQGHHTYSASQYPHLANRPEVIFPATFNEHFYGWHGGNWKMSLPGERINTIEDF
ncbi:hypothetical protein [Streptococcus gordonii]|uniref:hypothetical protein n=1 Tax=Streptococcus gordonii TaxID=1302 RepID=UPI000768883A|nr:hypothetical protein [Streptococcus gordonii]KXC03095.1 hypothetical protein AWH02_05950 [Streptococcus gordonii]MBZ2150649.1 hypothetical protein [Streptococcus gordonii]QWZ58069.1 hypothetical protein I6L84_02195 [Streptococcus gordonii]SQF29540.1 Uncharacterised protein [Streptococcus gordonii]